MGYHTPGSQSFYTKLLRTQRKPKSKIFKPIGQWPGLIQMMNQTGGKKSRWTVPLRWGTDCGTDAKCNRDGNKQGTSKTTPSKVKAEKIK